MARLKNILSAARSENMRAIRSFGNKTTELRLKGVLARRAISGWTLHNKGIMGTPDLCFPRERLAVFVDGCFWHSCPKCGHVPKTNRAYWRAKICRNRARDARITRKLRRLGFSVVRVWECDLRKRPLACVGRIKRALRRRQAGKP